MRQLEVDNKVFTHAIPNPAGKGRGFAGWAKTAPRDHQNGQHGQQTEKFPNKWPMEVRRLLVNCRIPSRKEVSWLINFYSGALFAPLNPR